MEYGVQIPAGGWEHSTPKFTKFAVKNIVIQQHVLSHLGLDLL